MKYPKYFSLKMSREKTIFPFKKQNLEHIGNSVHTTKYLAFGKTVLANLMVKVYITNWLNDYIIYQISHGLNEVILLGFFSDLENLSLLDIKWTLILELNFFDDLPELCLFTRCLYFHQLMKRKRSKNQLFKYFWRILLRKKMWKLINTVNSR